MSAQEAPRDEWLRLMLELGRLNRDAYRRFRGEVWAEIARGHRYKTPEELASWADRSS